MEIDTDANRKEAGKKVLQSIFEDGKASTSTNASNLSSTYYTNRVEGKRLQLGNPDRPRPIPKDGSLAQHQIQRRDQRLIKQKQKRQLPITVIDNGKGKEKEKVKPFSRRHRQRLGLEALDANLSYEILAPVHQLWLNYIHRLLGLVDENGQLVRSHFQLKRSSKEQDDNFEIQLNPNVITAFQTSLIKADFSGAFMRVTRALNPSLVGIEGLVARETESTIIIVTKSLHPKGKKNRRLVKTVPKHSSIFSLHIPLPLGAIPDTPAHHQHEIQVPLYGNQLCNTMQTRATKKFKARKTIDL